MLKNYFKIAFRKLTRGKLYSLINIIGMTCGITCCLLISLYVKHEMSYDRFHENTDHIYRAIYFDTDDGSKRAYTPIALAETIASEFPEVENSIRISASVTALRVGNDIFEQRVVYTDPGFFRMFDFGMVRGKSGQIFETPGQIVLSKNAAQKYFGDDEAVGKEVELRIGSNYKSFVVAGITENPPSNSSIHFEVLASFVDQYPSSEIYQGAYSSWGALMPRTFIQLHPEALAAEFQEKVNTYLKEQVDEKYFQNTTVEFQPLSEMHLADGIHGNLEATSKPVYLVILSAIGLFVLVLACINYTTLSIGNSVSRAREVGLRKTLGSIRSQLFVRFFGETGIIILLSLIAALFLTEWIMPVFNSLTGKEFTLSMVNDPVIMLSLIGILILTAFLAGSYPALFLSKFNPAEVLKGNLKIAGNPMSVQVLVALQFGISFCLLAATLLMNKQLTFVSDKDLGFNSEQIIRLDVPANEGVSAMNRLRQQLSVESFVIDVSGSFGKIPTGPGINPEGLETTSMDRQIDAHALIADRELVNVLDVEIIKGRNTSPDANPGTRNEVLVNEAFVQAFSWEDPIGKRISMFSIKDAEVVGVVRDFHFMPLHEEIRPLAINTSPAFLNYIKNIYIRLQSGNISSSISAIEEHWKKAAPDIPFVFNFLDEEVQQQYRAEQQWIKITRYSSIVAIIIACLGLFGLASLSTASRTKEIGIRKVLGASIANVTSLLSKDFLKPVIAGYVVALPVIYIAMSRWLESFAYKVNIGSGIFILTGLIILLIALMAVGWQSIKAAMRNPVESLRSE